MLAEYSPPSQPEKISKLYAKKFPAAASGPSNVGQVIQSAPPTHHEIHFTGASPQVSQAPLKNRAEPLVIRAWIFPKKWLGQLGLLLEAPKIFVLGFFPVLIEQMDQRQPREHARRPGKAFIWGQREDSLATLLLCLHGEHSDVPQRCPVAARRGEVVPASLFARPGRGRPHGTGTPSVQQGVP